MEFWFLRIGFRPDGRRTIAGGLPLWAHHRIFGPQWFAPGWALEAGSIPVPVGFSVSRSPLLFQRPSGRKPMFLPASGRISSPI
ncbi:MAG: hypothetical protein HY774_12230 [Acidobacteria bacterium]|nr:hypothetical protein [Acidobacteriota bacterium]